jgi:hypothetical protein
MAAYGCAELPMQLQANYAGTCPKADPCPSSEHSLEAAIRDSAEPLHSRGAGQAAVALLSCGKSGFPLPPIVIKLWREGSGTVRRPDSRTSGSQETRRWSKADSNSESHPRATPPGSHKVRC